MVEDSTEKEDIVTVDNWYRNLPTCVGSASIPVNNGRPFFTKYDMIMDRYLYNRCHLIGYQLVGENANEKNLITGTRYLNVEGMLPWENLVVSGILMEAYSVEDNGEGICFNVYCCNVQPGIIIDYET